jgi:DNA polymerase-1
MNTPIQGSAADLIKLAMVRIYKRMRKENLRSKMILQVHDELVFEVTEGEKDVMEKIVTGEMSAAIRLDVPIKVDVHFGPNWAEVH